jgi:glycosyltransferase involved in cell wall biosynthesis
LGEDGEILNSLVGVDISYDKVIVHSTPDLWAQWTKFERNKHIIGYTVWETSKIHPTWTMACNRVDEVWLPCDWNMYVFRDSGVTVPLHKIPHAIDVPDLGSVPDFNIGGVGDNDYVFYSIFQWQERKNPYGLLAAYCAAFTDVNDVVLVLKTYLHDHGGDAESVVGLIKEYKKYMTLDHFPKICVVVENMSREGILGLHKRGDCFVLMQRSEGWGLPHFEAAAMGNPVITPSYGGQSDFLNVENSYPVDYSLTPVVGMPWSPYYRGDQMWCEPDTDHAMGQMRHVYNNRDDGKAKGLLARENIQENFTLDRIGDMIVNRLVDIDRGEK